MMSCFVLNPCGSRKKINFKCRRQNLLTKKKIKKTQDLRLFGSQSLSIANFLFIRRRKPTSFRTKASHVSQQIAIFAVPLSNRSDKFSRFFLSKSSVRLFHRHKKLRRNGKANLMDDQRITKRDKTIFCALLT